LFKNLIKNSHSTLARQPHRISNQDTNTLQIIFEKCSVLNTVYDLKNQLHDILHSRNLKHENLIQVINEWRKEAQSKGIDCLDDFSESLKGYKVV
jgi:F0F1-type ATP synthase delta subunit